jgi:hypothetical protein
MKEGGKKKEREEGKKKGRQYSLSRSACQANTCKKKKGK